MISCKSVMVVMLAITYIFLAGCSDGEIAKLKESSVPAHEEYAVGQLFDNRRLCDETNWESYKGDRGEDVIEYICYMRGVKEYERELVSEYSKKFRSILDEKNKFEEEGDVLKREIRSGKEWLVRDRKALKDVGNSREAKELKRRVEEGNEYLSYVSTLDIDNIVKDGVEIDRRFLMGSQLGPGVVRKGPSGEIFANRDFSGLTSSLVAKIKSPTGGDSFAFGEVTQKQVNENRKQAKEKLLKILNEMTERVTWNINNIEADLERHLAEWREIRERNLNERVASIDRDEKRLKEVISKIENHDEEFSKHIEGLVSDLEKELDDVYAKEIFRWVITPDEDYALVYAGFEERSSIRGEGKYEYYKPKYAIQRIAVDEIRDFESFMKSTGGDEQKRYLLSSKAIQLNAAY